VLVVDDFIWHAVHLKNRPFFEISEVQSH
jgi:hypothetical protein